MNESELRWIEQRCEKATPGPWHVDVGGDPVRWVSKEGGEVPYWDKRADGDVVEKDDPYYPHKFCFDTQIFVAHAREDVPVLIAEVRRLKGVLLAMYELNYEQTCSEIEALEELAGEDE